MSGRKILLGLTAIGLALAMGACSSSKKKDNVTGASTGQSSTAAGAATGTSVKVGVICSCDNATFGGNSTSETNAWKAGINAINDAGGVNGHKIEIVQQQDAGNPGKSLSAVQKLVSAKVVAIADFSFVDQAWASTIGKAGVPIVGGDLAGAVMNSYPDFYPQGQTQDSDTNAVVVTAKSVGAASMGILYCTEAPTCIDSAKAAKADAGSAGLKVSYSAQATSAEPNYTAQCLAAKNAHADALFLLYAPTTAKAIAADCARQGYLPKYLMEGGAISFHVAESATGLKANLAGPFANRPSIDTGNPGVQAMNAAIDKYYPGLENQPEWTELGTSSYVAGLLQVAALKAGGLTPSTDATPEMVVKGLESMKGETLGGMAPPLTFEPGKPHSITCWFTASVVNGTAQTTNGGNTTCS